MAPLVLLVIEGGEGQDVQEQQGRPHGDGDAQLGGVIPFWSRRIGPVVPGARLVRVLGVLGVAVGWGDGRAFGRGPDLEDEQPVLQGKTSCPEGAPWWWWTRTGISRLSCADVGPVPARRRLFVGPIVILTRGFKPMCRYSWSLGLYLDQATSFKRLGFV